MKYFVVGICLLAAQCLGATFDAIASLATTQYDFVVVGGGTAGLVVANRLSEDPGTSVLVIEAGVSNEGALDTIVPFFCTRATPNTLYDWNYTTTPQAELNGRVLPYARGHILGGSSSVNYMAYTRGSSEDYDRIAATTGDPGWSWSNLQPYIRRNEILTPPADHHNTQGEIEPSVHGHSGINGDSLAGFPTPLDDKVVLTTRQFHQEFPFNIDTNSGSHLGVGWMVSTVRDGVRSSSATSYLGPKFNHRPNLHVILNTRVTRILPDPSSKHFRTVELAQTPDGPRVRITAKKEIILSAGSFGTPQILMNSGIGDSVALANLGIKTVFHNPSVGQNLTDHAIVQQSWFVNETNTWERAARNATVAAEQFELWNTTRTGPLTDIPANQVAWLRIPSNSSIFKQFADPAAGPQSAHYELLFSNGFLGIPPPTGNFMTIPSAVVSPLSRGYVKLNTSNPFDAPIINPNLLSSDFDMFVMREAVRSVQRFVTAQAWIGYVLSPTISLETDEEIDAFMRNTTTPLLHPVGTAAMTARSAGYGVVDPDLKVKGVSGLRVVDASVFPHIPTAHTQVPTYILAERASDLIKADWR